MVCYPTLEELRNPEWANHDLRVVILNPWHYYTVPAGGRIPCNMGLEDMPATLAKWKESGEGRSLIRSNLVFVPASGGSRLSVAEVPQDIHVAVVGVYTNIILYTFESSTSFLLDIIYILLHAKVHGAMCPCCIPPCYITSSFTVRTSCCNVRCIGLVGRA